ncbi:MAG: AmmeMemoRadiSam system protein B [Actinomycetales bacterium]
MRDVRPAAVAGFFYPEDPFELARVVDSLVSAASVEATGEDSASARGVRPSPAGRGPAWLLPHAGYRYSGSTAAAGYAELALANPAITRVLLLGPCHRVRLDGVALPQARAMQSPLGLLPVPQVDAEIRSRLPALVDSAAAHADEHSIEVHLPFLQRTLGEVEVIPLAVGRVSPEAVAQIIDALWTEPATALVISSDLSHYLPYERARQVDAATIEQIGGLGGPLTHQQACGATPANGLLVQARRVGARPRVVRVCNSGDTGGDRRRVVGYAAVAFDG